MRDLEYKTSEYLERTVAEACFRVKSSNCSFPVGLH